VGAAVPAAISFTFSVETTSRRSESGSHILIEPGASAQHESQSRKWIFVCADYLGTRIFLHGNSGWKTIDPASTTDIG
jgi:hypothetical protein